TAQYAAPRPDNIATGSSFTADGVVKARKTFVVSGAEIADRKMQPEVAVFVAGFQQQHLHRRICRQTIGENAPGGTRPDDDVVVGLPGGVRLAHAFTVSRYRLGSKYCEAGTALGMLAKSTKKSVTCCSHWVTVPSLYILAHSCEVNIFCAWYCSLMSDSGTRG